MHSCAACLRCSEYEIACGTRHTDRHRHSHTDIITQIQMHRHTHTDRDAHTDTDTHRDRAHAEPMNPHRAHEPTLSP